MRGKPRRVRECGDGLMIAAPLDISDLRPSQDPQPCGGANCSSQIVKHASRQLDDSRRVGRPATDGPDRPADPELRLVRTLEQAPAGEFGHKTMGRRNRHAGQPRDLGERVLVAVAKGQQDGHDLAGNGAARLYRVSRHQPSLPCGSGRRRSVVITRGPSEGNTGRQMRTGRRRRLAVSPCPS